MEDNYPFSVLKEAIARKVSPHAMWLLTYYITNPGESFKFHQSYILFLTGWGNKTYLKYRKELIEKGFITSEYARENGKRAGSYVTVNRTFSKVSDVNVSDKHLSTSKVSKGNVTKGNVTKGNVTERHDIREEVERERINKRKEVKAAVAAEGDRLSASAGAAASEAAPAAAAAADSPSPEISRSQDNKPRQSSKAAATPLSQNPPAQADVEASVARVAAKSHVAGWTPEAIKFKAFTIWNHYELKKWKRADGTDITDLNSCVFCWMKRDGFRPPVMNEPAPAPHPSPVPAASPAPASQELSGLLPGQWAGAPVNQKPQQKSFKQQEWDWIERPLTDPEAWTVEDSAHLIFKARSDGEVQGILNSIPEHLHERALALAEQMRKEQGDKPRIIAPLPYEEETS